MQYVGGDYIEITYNHPTLGSGTFYPVSGESAAVDDGGFRSDDEQNSIAGNGEMIDVMKRVRWSVEIACAWSLGVNEDTKKLSALASSSEQADWTFTHVSGAIQAAKGKPVGDIQGDSGAGTFTLKVSGGGQLKNI